MISENIRRSCKQLELHRRNSVHDHELMMFKPHLRFIAKIQADVVWFPKNETQVKQ